MSWKDDLKDMADTSRQMENQLKAVMGHLALNEKRMIELKGSMDAMRTSQSRAADRMADRMIEMAMVNKGQGREAAGHRRSLDEHVEDTTDLWKNAGDDWPPPGCDSMEMP